MRGRRVLAWCVGLLTLGAVLGYLYDPPWIADVTSGVGPWQVDTSGARYRWTNGHGSLFLPSDAVAATMPVRAPYAGRGDSVVRVRISVDDRLVTELSLDEPNHWVSARVLVPRRATRRRYRRLDVRVNRTVGSSNFGVQIGEIALDRTGTW